MMPEPNCKWLPVSFGGQRSCQCCQTQSSLSCQQSLSQKQVKHYRVPLHGQHYSCCPCKQQRGKLFSSASQPNSRSMKVVPTRIPQSASRASTHNTYQSAWGLWHSSCAKRKVNPLSATLIDVFVFLTDRFNNGGGSL